MISDEQLIWEGLPHAGIPVKHVIYDIANGIGKTPEFIEIPVSILKEKLSKYLDVEPLWRECALKISKSNLFSVSGLKPTLQETWLSRCSVEQNTTPDLSTRMDEAKMLQSFLNA